MQILSHRTKFEVEEDGDVEEGVEEAEEGAKVEEDGLKSCNFTYAHF